MATDQAALSAVLSHAVFRVKTVAKRQSACVTSVHRVMQCAWFPVMERIMLQEVGGILQNTRLFSVVRVAEFWWGNDGKRMLGRSRR